MGGSRRRAVAGGHACPGRCGVQVPRHLFACQPCWYAVPTVLREAIRRSFRRDPAAHLQAMVTAVAWFEDHHQPQLGEVFTAEDGEPR